MQSKKKNLGIEQLVKLKAHQEGDHIIAYVKIRAKQIGRLSYTSVLYDAFVVNLSDWPVLLVT